MRSRTVWIVVPAGVLLIWALRTAFDGAEVELEAAAPSLAAGEQPLSREQGVQAPRQDAPREESGAREHVGVGQPQSETSERTDSQLADGYFESWIEQLRRLAREVRFHEPALGLVQQAVPHVRAGRVEVARLRAVLDDGVESERVRGACLLTVAMAVSAEESRPLMLETLNQYTGELERAAWLGLAVAVQGESGRAVRPADFKSATELQSYPVTLHLRVGTEDVERALQRLGQQVPGSFDEPEASTRLDVRDERFTREWILCTILSHHVGSSLAVREKLLDWAVARENPGRLMRVAAVWCLARASADSEECAQQLALRARQEGGYFGLHMLQGLAFEGGREDLVLDAVREILVAGGEGFSEDALITVEGLHALTAVLESDDDDLRFAATQFAVERILDPTLSERNRGLYLNRLAASGSDALLDVAKLAHEAAEPSEFREHIIRYLGRVGPDQEGAAREFLMQNFSPALSESAQIATLRSIAEIGGADALAFLTQVAQSGATDQVRAEARALLDKG